MREIKFRAKERSGEWVVGGLFVEDGMGISYIVSGVNTHYETNYSTVEVVPETVGEFTGLKDHKGREIYEGDIIRYKDENGRVYYENDCFGVAFYEDYATLLIVCDECEVVGNVHDNPELLEQN